MITYNTVTNELIYVHAKEICTILDVSICTFERLLKHYHFPKPIRVSKTRKWFSCEVKLWIKKKLPNKLEYFERFLLIGNGEEGDANEI